MKSPSRANAAKKSVVADFIRFYLQALQRSTTVNAKRKWSLRAMRLRGREDASTWLISMRFSTLNRQRASTDDRLRPRLCENSDAQRMRCAFGGLWAFRARKIEQMPAPQRQRTPVACVFTQPGPKARIDTDRRFDLRFAVVLSDRDLAQSETALARGELITSSTLLPPILA
jgi:hypothetical protein